MNHVTLTGRLTDDPDIRRTQEGKQVARYTLAVDRRGKDNGADFIRCTTFEGGADFADRYLHKGTKIAVMGNIHTGSYTDKDGKKIYTTEVYVRDHYFCQPKDSGETQSRSNDYGRGNSYPTQAEGFADVTDDSGVPFR